jgi:hypothetical protein
MPVEYSERLNDIIKKWEDKYNKKYKGIIKIGSGPNAMSLSVYDKEFVEAMMRRIDKFYKEEEEYKKMLVGLKDRLTA